MGWRGQDNREKDWEAELRKLPVSERFAWRWIAWVVIALLLLAIVCKMHHP